MEENTITQVLLRPEFSVHLLNDTGKDRAFSMAGKFTDLINWLETDGGCISCPELTIAKRKLEEACFYAKKAMAINLVNQEHG